MLLTFCENIRLINYEERILGHSSDADLIELKDDTVLLAMLEKSNSE